MIGAPIYLVSACGSGAEFVAAFRRYADKQGIFIPIAEPFPVGRRGRIALTLKTGGVMIEGEAEVVMSSKTPSALYGRVGMTLRFIEPDDASRLVIGELEKARLSMKAPDTASEPRPAEVPAEPRAVVPATGGRIDAANALAESVAIGDVAGLREAAGAPLKTGPKFVIPSIPAGRSPGKPATIPPFDPKPKPAAKVDEAPVAAKVDAATKPEDPAPIAAAAPADPASIVAPTDPSPTNAAAPKVTSTQPVSVVPPPSRPPTDRPVASEVAPTPTSRSPITATQPVSIAPPPVQRTRGTLPPPPASLIESKPPAPPTLPVGPPPVIEESSSSREDPTTPYVPSAKEMLNTTQRGTGPGALVKPPLPPPRSTPPAATPVVAPPVPPTTPAATPIVAPPLPPTTPEPVAAGRAGPEVEISEPTDLTNLPSAGTREPRRTIIGMPAVFVEPAFTISEGRDTAISDAVSPAVVGSLDVDPHGETLSPDAMMVFSPPPPDEAYAPTLRPEALAHPPTVEESTPSGDWTMTPDGPMATPKPAPKPVIPRGPPTGDWTIAVDAEMPDGWVAARPAAPPTKVVPKGPRVTSVASAEPLDLKTSWEPESTGIAIPKVEIDPTLMEPLLPMPLDDEPMPPPEPMPMPMGIPTPLPMQVAVPMGMPTPLPMQVPTIDQGWSTPVPMPMPQMQSSEPMQQMFAAPMAQGPAYMTPIPGQLVMPDAQQQQQMMGFPPPPPRMATEGGAVYFHETGPFQAPRDSTSMLELGRRRRLLVIAISAALVVALGIVLLVKLGGKKHADEPPLDEHAVVPLTKTADAAASAPPMAPGDAAVAVAIPVDGTPEVQPAIPDAAATFVMAADAAVEPAGCSVEVTTTPAGAEIAIDNHTVIGTSPGSFPLPCGAVTKLYIRKPTYSGVIWPVTPTAEGAKVRVTLVKPATTLQVKVSSSPAGATITANGKSMGTTPTVIKLPAFEAVTIVIAKEGYVSETQKITPKADRQAVHAQLKRAPKRH